MNNWHNRARLFAASSHSQLDPNNRNEKGIEKKVRKERLAYFMRDLFSCLG